MDRYTGKEALEDDEYCDQYGTARERWVKSSVLDRTIDQLTHANGLLDEIRDKAKYVTDSRIDYDPEWHEVQGVIARRKGGE